MWPRPCSDFLSEIEPCSEREAEGISGGNAKGELPRSRLPRLQMERRGLISYYLYTHTNLS